MNNFDLFPTLTKFIFVPTNRLLRGLTYVPNLLSNNLLSSPEFSNLLSFSNIDNRISSSDRPNLGWVDPTRLTILTFSRPTDSCVSRPESPPLLLVDLDLIQPPPFWLPDSPISLHWYLAPQLECYHLISIPPPAHIDFNSATWIYSPDLAFVQQVTHISCYVHFGAFTLLCSQDLKWKMCAVWVLD